MKLRAFQLVLWSCCLLGANVPCSATDELKAQRALESKNYTVRVEVESGDIVTSSVESGHGTGFIIELSETVGYVMTNRHVVLTPARMIRRVRLEFFAGGDEAPERVPGEVVFISPIYDVAIVTFNPSELKRVGRKIHPAPLATAALVEKYGQAGASVMASGNPLSSRDICTFGTISGVFVMNWAGRFFQIDAAINPGNSGGPLVHLSSGLVIGMNTAKMEEGENMGFALPIPTAMEEFRSWRKRRSYARHRSLMSLLDGYPVLWLRGLGLEEAISQENLEPDFLDRYEQLFTVIHTVEGSGLEKGDVILSIGGQVIGDRGYRIREVTQRSREKWIPAKVIRRNKVISPLIRVYDETAAERRAREQFIIVSGFIFAEVDRFISEGKVGGVTHVYIENIVPNTIAADRYHGLAGAFLEAVRVNGKTFRVDHLKDLKRALGAIPEDGPHAVSLLVRLPMSMGASGVPVDSVFDLPLLQTHSRDIVIPVHQVISNETHDFEALRARFDFDGFKDPGSRGGLSSLAAYENNSCEPDIRRMGEKN